MRGSIRRKVPAEIADNRLRHLNQALIRQIEEETEKRLLQERLLIQQSRMAAMGEMIGVIAHQWRQPLNALAIMIQNIQDAYEFGELDQAFIEDTVQRSMQQIQTMSRTIDDFREFSRSDATQEFIDVRKACNDVLLLLSGLFCAHDVVATCACEPDERPPIMVLGCCNAFKQAVFNLLKNAHDAILERRKRGDLNSQGRIALAITSSPDSVCHVQSALTHSG